MTTEASESEHPDVALLPIDDASTAEERSDVDDESTDTRDRGPLRRSTLGALAAVGVVLSVASLVTVAIEQHRQTTELRRQSCYARASAVAQVATIELQRGTELVPDAGLALLFCDGE